MLTTHDFGHQPLTLSVTDEAGAVEAVSVRSGERSSVIMSCTCRHYAAEGVVPASRRSRLHAVARFAALPIRILIRVFEEIMAGTPLESAAHDADLRLTIVRRHGADVRTDSRRTRNARRNGDPSAERT